MRAPPIAPDDPRLAPIRRCLLCKAPATIHALYEPADQALWGAEPGQLRRIAYGVCDSCFERADLIDAVEAQLWRSMSGGAS